MSNNKQQTAVEQLISKIPLGMRMQLAELGVDFEQAKEMEKEQTEQAKIDAKEIIIIKHTEHNGGNK
jgi:hypothetical protein